MIKKSHNGSNTHLFSLSGSGVENWCFSKGEIPKQAR